MSVINHQGKQLELDAGGYLKDFHDWDENVARELAAREGISQLSDEELEVIRFLRVYYGKYGSFPVMASVCKNVQQPQDCVNEEFIDPVKAWKIAGLPEPNGEVLSYLRRE